MLLSPKNPKFFPRFAITVTFVAVFLMPFLLRGSVLTLDSNRNDAKDWLPEHFAETQDYEHFAKLFPHQGFILVSWKGTEDGKDEGATLDDPRVTELAERIINWSPDLKYLKFSRSLVKRLEALKLTNAREIRKFDEDAKKTGGLVKNGFTPKEVNQILTTIKQRQSPFSSVQTGKSLVEEMERSHQALANNVKEIYRRLEGSLIGKDHKSTCLIILLNEYSQIGNKNLHLTLDVVVQQAVASGVKKENLRCGGPPVDNVETDKEGEKTLIRLAILSLVVGLGVGWLCFRSIRLTILIFFTGASGQLLPRCDNAPRQAQRFCQRSFAERINALFPRFTDHGDWTWFTRG